jgi:plasmid stabilization system protein ParE
MPDTPPFLPPKVKIVTPKKAQDIEEAIRKIARDQGPVRRQERALLEKAGKTIASLASQVALARAKSPDLAKELEKHEPDKW